MWMVGQKTVGYAYLKGDNNRVCASEETAFIHPYSKRATEEKD